MLLPGSDHLATFFASRVHTIPWHQFMAVGGIDDQSWVHG